MTISRDQLRERIGKGEIAPVYTLFGPETFLRDLAAKTIVDRTFREGEMRDFNDDVISLNTPDNIRSALAAADQLPMMATRRAVRVTDVRVAATATKDTLKEAHYEALAAYLDNPSPSTVLIFIASELNKSRKIGKLLEQKTVAVDFARLNDADLLKWVSRGAADIGCQIDSRTARHLIATVGSNVGRLTTEVGKLATAALPEKAITIDLIDSLVANVRELRSFDLTDHLIIGDKKRAVAAASKLLDDGAEPLMLLGMLAGTYHRLLIVKDLMEQGVDRERVAAATKQRFDRERFVAAARRADKNALRKAIRRMAETDVAIKTSVGGSGPHGARLQIEMLICELASAEQSYT